MKNAKAWKRWLVWFLLVVVFSVACVFLSEWQFSRRAEAVAKIHSLAENYDQAPADLSSVAGLTSFDSSNEWRPVSLTGHFITEHAVLVRNRPYNGAPGFLQLIPFQTLSGDIVAIETGWLATGDDNKEPKLIPLPTDEERRIVARIRPSEPTLNRDAPKGQLATINIDALVEKENLVGRIHRNIYLRLGASYNNSDSPKVLPKPELTEGNHLSYALQWILFALMAFGALWWAIKQERQAKRIAVDPDYRPRVRKKVGDADKAAEDALFDL
jgi:cytochrome oxidase assembly protein ShyY1